MWSCGVLLYTLFFGSFPFHRREDDQQDQDSVNQAVMQRILNVEYTIPSYCRSAEGLKPVSPALRDLLSHILKRDPRRRLNMQQLMNHPWFLKDLPIPALTMNHHLPTRPVSSQSEDEVTEILAAARTMPASLASIRSADVEYLIDTELHEELARLQLYRGLGGDTK